MISFSIDKQRGKVNVEWMSRPVDVRQPLALVLTSMEQSLTFAYKTEKETFEWPNFRGSLHKHSFTDRHTYGRTNFQCANKSGRIVYFCFNHFTEAIL
jgi:hypothetical protein